MSSDPLVYLHAAHARAEMVAKALPCGPWAWRRYSDPNWCHTLEGPDGFTEAVLKSATPSPGASWIELHPAFDEFLPEPEAVLRRIAGERKQLELHAAGSDGDCATCGEDDGPVEVNGMMLRARTGVAFPCPTVRLVAEGWGWTEGES